MRQVSAVLNRPMYNPRLAPISEAAQSLLTATGEPSYDSFLDETERHDDNVPTLVIFANPSVNQAQFSTFVPSLDEASAATASRPKTLLPQPDRAKLLWVDCGKSSSCLPAFRTWLSSQSGNLVSLQSLTIDRRVIPAHVAIYSALRPPPKSSVSSVDLVTVSPQGQDHGQCGLLFRARLSSVQMPPNISAQTVLITKHFIECPRDDSFLAEDDCFSDPPLILSPFSGGASSMEDTSKDRLWAENFLGLMATLAQTRCKLVVEMFSINDENCAPPHYALISPMTPMSAILRKVSAKLIAKKLTPTSDVSPFIEWQSAMLNGHVLALSGDRSGIVRHPALFSSLLEPSDPAGDPTEQKRHAASIRYHKSVAEAVDFKQDCISHSTSAFLQERLRVVKASRRPLRSVDEKNAARSDLLQNLRKRLNEDDRKYLENAPQVAVLSSPQVDAPSCDDVRPDSEGVENYADAKISQALDPVLPVHSISHGNEVVENNVGVKTSQVVESLPVSSVVHSTSASKMMCTSRSLHPLPIASVEGISVSTPPPRPARNKCRFEGSVQKLNEGVNVLPLSPIVIQSSESMPANLHHDENSRESQAINRQNAETAGAPKTDPTVFAVSPERSSCAEVTAHENRDTVKSINASADIKSSLPCSDTGEKVEGTTYAECDSPLELLLEAATMKEKADHLLQLARKRETWNDTDESIFKGTLKDEVCEEDEDDIDDGLESKRRVSHVENASEDVKHRIAELLGSRHALAAVRNCLSALAHLASVLDSEGRVSSQVRRMVKSYTAKDALDSSVCRELQGARTRMRVQSGWMVDNDLSVGQWGAIMGALEVVVWLSAAATFGLRKRKGHKRVKRLASRVQMIVSCVQVCGELSGASKETTELYQECLQRLFGCILSPFSKGWKGKPAEWLLDLMEEHGSRNLLVTPEKNSKRSREKSVGSDGADIDKVAHNPHYDGSSPSSRKRVRYESCDDRRERKVSRPHDEDGIFDGKRGKSNPRTSIKEIAEILKERKEGRKLVSRTRFASVENRIHGGGTLNCLAIKPEVAKPKKRDKRKERLEQKEKRERVDALLRGLSASRRDDFEDEIENEGRETEAPIKQPTPVGRFALDESALNMVERYNEDVDTLFEDLPPDTPKSNELVQRQMFVAETPVD